jgi:hypothetical protein
MAKKKTSRATEKLLTRFAVDLGKVELTDKQVSNLKNKITGAAIAAARKKGPKPPKEPFVKLTFGKSIPPY